jgi:hypothetical protein
VRARVPGAVVDDVHEALRTGELVLVWSLRGTRHVHPAADVRWLVGLLGPVFGRPAARARQLGIDGAVGEEAVAALHEGLAGGPLTRAEVRELLAPVGVDPEGQAAVHVLHRAACEGVLVVVPDPDGDERYARFDDVVPADPDPPASPEDAAGRLARRHVAAFGPATPDDFATWSGLPRALARAGWAAAAAGPELAEVATPTGPAWVSAPVAAALDEGAGPAPLRLLGGFDALLLGYADRSLHLPAAQARAVNAGGGMVRPVVVDDGRVVATWKLRRRGRRREVDLAPLPGGPPIDGGALGAELTDVGRFLGLPEPLAPP